MPQFDSPVGRYVHLELEGHDHRVYFEEAGEGIPLLLQHTAGAHGAQWRHLFEEPRITEHFRLIAYDMPFHGKSLPPDGREWWAEEYLLTREFAETVPLTLAAALDLDRPVFMGCSIGGLLALDLARDHPARFRAIIGLEPALKIGGSLDDLPGFWHPRVSGEYKATMMYGLTSPLSPEARRRETVFVYSEGWPPSFRGDLNYYIEDHDLRELAGEIDTEECPLFLLSGEYDWSATPGHARAAHEAIPGSSYTLMEGLGHFPMAEDPERFVEFLLPVLSEIRSL
ncbi:MAG: alpha/beta fold hydrolase [Dehalococcoidia bacterium]